MEEFLRNLEILLENPNVPEETKKAVRIMLQDEKERQEKLFKEMERILRKEF
jgi:hypothetical protein